MGLQKQILKMVGLDESHIHTGAVQAKSATNAMMLFSAHPDDESVVPTHQVTINSIDDVRNAGFSDEMLEHHGIEESHFPMTATLTAVQDIVVEPGKPLVLKSQPDQPLIATYGTITLKPGAQIVNEDSNTVLTANQLIQESATASNSTPPAVNITNKGADGLDTPASPDQTGQQQKANPGNPGDDGKHSCNRAATDGDPGATGLTGINGQPGGKAGKAKSINIMVDELNGIFTLATIGGNGGKGGDGGKGGKGGTGGDGGAKRGHCDAGQQGVGGTGGTGGTGGPGANGGAAGDITVTYKTLTPGSYIAAATTQGGRGGAGGAGGAGGDGGDGRSRGATGQPGNPGTPGDGGDSGTITINGQQLN